MRAPAGQWSRRGSRLRSPARRPRSTPAPGWCPGRSTRAPVLSVTTSDCPPRRSVKPAPSRTSPNSLTLRHVAWPFSVLTNENVTVVGAVHREVWAGAPVAGRRLRLGDPPLGTQAAHPELARVGVGVAARVVDDADGLHDLAADQAVEAELRPCEAGLLVLAHLGPPPAGRPGGSRTRSGRSGGASRWRRSASWWRPPGGSHRRLGLTDLPLAGEQPAGRDVPARGRGPRRRRRAP